jgi:hypothetical protein
MNALLSLRAFGLALLCLLVSAPAAFAWQVTVRVHGSGTVVETTPRNLMNCTVSSSVSESTVTNCVAGTPTGVYNHGDIVELQASVGATAFNRGWRFLKWVDASGGGNINCDPQDSTGDHLLTACRFQIFENLGVDLYFDDIHGPSDTSIGSGPTGTVSSTSATFGFNALSDPDASFECRLDRPGMPTGSFVPCGSPFDKSEAYSSLTTNGLYTFNVRSTDPSGNVGSTASRSWTVDTVGPITSISGGPANGSRTTGTTAGFSLGANEPGSFQCKLDRPGNPGAFSPCGASPGYASLGDGTHTFSARAVDGVGNVGAAVSRTWTVDTTGPTASIGSGPANGSRTTSTGASFGLTSTEPGSFQCKLDGPGGPGTFGACDSTPDYAGLGDGTYTFSARALDDLGNVGPSVTRTWTVDTTAPDTSITGGPNGAISSSSPTFTFSSSEASSTFECKLDSGAWEPCNSGSKGYTSLAEGEHSFYVRATDTVGLTDASEAVRTWTVDTVRPDTQVTSGPSGETAATTAAFEFTATEPGATFECKLDAGAWESCATGKSYSGLGAGSHTFLVRATDAAGNLDLSEAVRSWTVTQPAGGTPSGGTPSGGTPSGGTPSGGTPSGGTPSEGNTPPPDTSGPFAVLGFSKSQRLARVLAKGLVGSGSSSESGRLRLDVLRSGKVVATSGNRALGAPGGMRLTAKFTTKAKRALAGVRSVKLTLRLTATDAAGNATVTKKTLTLRR